MKKKMILVIAVLLGLVFQACKPTKDAQQVRVQELNPNGIVQLYIVAKPRSLDPIIASSDRYSNTIDNYVLEALYDYDYYQDSYELIPLLAAAMPEVSEDGLSYTFRIREGIYYYDPSHEVFAENSREVKAQDFVFSLLRLADLAENGQGFWLIDGFLVGFNEWRAQSENGGDYQNIPKGVEILSDYSFRINLLRPYPQLMYFLTMNYMAPMPQELYDFYGRDGLVNKLVGTGPYFLDPQETIDDSRYVFRPNPSFRNLTVDSPAAPSAIKGLPLPLNGGLDIRIIEEAVPAWLSFQQGGIDLYTPGKDQFDQAIVGGELTDELKERGVSLDINAQGDLTYSFFNYEHPAWGAIMKDPDKGVRVRKAIKLAYDIDTVIEVQYSGRAVPANSPVPPIFAGFSDYKSPSQRYDVEEARELLSEAGYPNGAGLPILSYEGASTSKAARDLFELFSKYMEAIGIRTEFIGNDWPSFSAKLDDGNFVWAGLGWGADYPDPQNFLQLIYGGNIGTTNHSRYKNEEFDRLYEEAAVMLPSPERSAIYRQMIDIFEAETPWVLGVHRLSYTMISPRIKNRNYNEFSRAPAKFFQIVE